MLPERLALLTSTTYRCRGRCQVVSSASVDVDVESCSAVHVTRHTRGVDAARRVLSSARGRGSDDAAPPRAHSAAVDVASLPPARAVFQLDLTVGMSRPDGSPKTLLSSDGGSGRDSRQGGAHSPEILQVHSTDDVEDLERWQLDGDSDRSDDDGVDSVSSIGSASASSASDAAAASAAISASLGGAVAQRVPNAGRYAAALGDAQFTSWARLNLSLPLRASARQR